MGREPRPDPPGGWHHVTNRGARRQPIFLDDRDRWRFIDRFAIAHERIGVEIACYALMGNHFHLVVYCPDGGLSTAMHLIESAYARQYNARHGFEGPLFTGRFGSRRITTDAQLIQTSRYVHRNPIDLGLTSPLADYQWSSFGAYLGKRPRPPWLDTSVVMGLVDGDPGRYLTYVETPMNSDKRVIHLPSSLTSEPGPDLRVDTLTPLIDLVMTSCAVDLSNPLPGQRCPERDAALVAAVDLNLDTTAAIAQAFGFASPGTVRSRISAIRRRNDPEVASLAQAFIGALAEIVELAERAG